MAGTALTISCSDWSDHYEDAEVNSDEITIYDGDMVSYMQTTADVSKMSALFEETGIYDSVFTDREYTFIVCDNDVYGDGSSITDEEEYAKYCVADMAVSPAKLVEGYGIYTREGKNVWVYEDENGGVMLDEYNIEKTVKTDNGYIYYIEGILPIRQSVYEFINSLGDEYSTFKALIAKFEEEEFDEENSAITGVAEDGSTTYDSVMVIANELMDRYTEDGVDYWNMRDESFISTVFIPTNDQIEHAINAALDSIPVWLNRDTTSDDREKFEEWVVKACFVNERLSEEEVNATAADFECVDGYQRIVDEQADSTSYESIDPAYWRPSIQTVDAENPVALSNGVAYYCTNFKIPNHIVIYRVKSRFYELWNAMNDTEKDTYFRWTHWTDPLIINDAQSEFELSSTLPTIYYHVLTAIPDSIAMADSLHCSVTYDGLVYDEDNDEVLECHLPAGEYYLRMGFKHSLTYSISITFCDTLLIEDMVLYAQGSNYHFDRGAASEIPHYGLGGVAYPEDFDVDYWQTIDEKAIAYDTDGYTVGIVNLKESGNFTITIDSKDEAYLYDATSTRDKNNVTQLMMYHWCLRPTTNNY